MKRPRRMGPSFLAPCRQISPFSGDGPPHGLRARPRPDRIRPVMRPFVGILALMALTSPARGADPLRYDQRQHRYNGLSATVTGDIRTVGMAGATVGLADTFLTASNNPAGCSMTLGLLD